jgi:predicted AlkP superfamily pyrophosphatase or phosphodiesterase
MNESAAVVPDYQGGSIVNLMGSIVCALDGEERLYPPLRTLPPGALTRRNIMLLVIDGLGHEWLLAHRPDGPLARHVRDRMTSVFPSTTATAVTTFLTGTAPQQHGITGWFMYFHELGTVLTVLPYQTRYGTPVPSVPAHELLEPLPVFDRVKARSHLIAPDRIVHSEFNIAYRGAARSHGFKSLGQLLETMTNLARAGGDRTYVYGYWPELDRLAHEHGIESREALAHLAELDTAFGAFLDSIVGTSTTVIVTGDHGFIDARADQMIEVGMHPELSRTLSLPLCGEGRAAYCYVHADRRQQFVAYVAAHFEEYVELKESSALIEARYFGLGPPHPRLHERIGDFTLILRERALIRQWLPGESRYVHIGVHGGMSAEEMYVPLIVADA